MGILIMGMLLLFIQLNEMTTFNQLANHSLKFMRNVNQNILIKKHKHCKTQYYYHNLVTIL